MTERGNPSARAEVSIDADAATVYRMITDLPTMASLAEEAHAMEWSKGDRPEPGAVFKGHNRSGSRTWTTRCTVTAAEPGRVFAFDVRSAVIPVAHWRYDIESTGEGACRVTESTWDRRPGWFKVPAGWATGVRDRDAANAEHIRLTLQRLKEAAEAGQ
ncbi:SRPBCC family protein [Mycolicibacterium flavescens]|uniref:Polyketide cyclase n=1 Tax=Mycolicibacterium flavescens TaxID=1776 RepID=A0A1E3RF40_MYCFV|nr:SRPBCC family protein [Mycolicibacterium flavescens]MCV7278726.1 SRPBCC family protein [Mycolicibacterium flavescens]ODQ88473.1 polyketide cyclase [Mycolicibacterium flavescens]